MKRFLGLFLAALLLFSACGTQSSPVKEDAPGGTPGTGLIKQLFSDVDFAASPFKHINNGGVTEDNTLLYNIDAISGATMTVEGPAVVTSIPLSIRELENRSAGLVRGTYADETGMFVYEGIDLWYLLTEMVEGDNGIGDGSESVAPFVFDAKNETEHSLGYVEALDNDDGCIKLVYDVSEYGSNDYPRFSNVAYVYVCEESQSLSGVTEITIDLVPDAYAHIAAPYDSLSGSSIRFFGEGLDKECSFTLAELESRQTETGNDPIDITVDPAVFQEG